MPVSDLAAKYNQFGWNVLTVDGHHFEKLVTAFKKAKQKSTSPVCIIAKTIMGKGISFMENDYHYHDVKDFSESFYLKAKDELQKS